MILLSKGKEQLMEIESKFSLYSDLMLRNSMESSISKSYLAEFLVTRNNLALVRNCQEMNKVLSPKYFLIIKSAH